MCGAGAGGGGRATQGDRGAIIERRAAEDFAGKGAILKYENAKAVGVRVM